MISPSGYTKLSQDTDQRDHAISGCERRSARRKRGGYEKLPDPDHDSTENFECSGLSGDVDDESEEDSSLQTSLGFDANRAERSPGRRRPPMLTMIEPADEESCTPTPLSPQQLLTLEFKHQVSGIEHVHASEFARRSPVAIVAEGLRQQLANIVSAEPVTGCPAASSAAHVPGSPAAAQDLQAARARLRSAATAAASTLAATLTAGSPMAARLKGSSARKSSDGHASGELRRNGHERPDVRTGKVAAHATVPKGPAEELDGLSPKAVVIGCRSEADLPRKTCQSEAGHLHSIALF
mmetsp:Transcript_11054/g.20655  ORF Transcript_11054/g.20655 Transcript_11054/m.20655 type:complete len:296 (+) Transcript_11054:44-931(+)